MNEATFKFILGKGYKGKSEYLKDSDGDKKINILDCKPYDPTRQGIMHSIGAFIAKKVGADTVAEKIEARGERIDEERAIQKNIKEDVDTQIRMGEIKNRKDVEERYAYDSPAYKMAKDRLQKIELEKAKDNVYFEEKKKMVIERAKKRAVDPYGLKAASRGVGGAVTAFGKVLTKVPPQTTTKKITTPPKKLQDRNRDGMPDLFGIHYTNNKPTRIPDVLGLHKDKKKYGGIPKIF
jgi:hypothetical protein